MKGFNEDTPTRVSYWAGLKEGREGGFEAHLLVLFPSRASMYESNHLVPWFSSHESRPLHVDWTRAAFNHLIFTVPYIRYLR